jgi:hypothetical protein
VQEDVVFKHLIISFLSDEDLVYRLYNTEALYSEQAGGHRWWDDVFNVAKVGDRFIGYEWAHSTGDKSLDDLGWEFDLSTVCFCEPYEVTETRYRKIADAGREI